MTDRDKPSQTLTNRDKVSVYAALLPNLSDFTGNLSDNKQTEIHTLDIFGSSGNVPYIGVFFPLKSIWKGLVKPMLRLYLNLIVRFLPRFGPYLLCHAFTDLLVVVFAWGLRIEGLTTGQWGDQMQPKMLCMPQWCSFQGAQFATQKCGKHTQNHIHNC